MVQDVRQWLDEVKRLQQQLTEIMRDRDEALESAAQWRQLYNTEAQQRRQEGKQYQETIDSLNIKIKRLQSFAPDLANEAQIIQNHQQEIEKLETLDEVKAKLVEVLLERDRVFAESKQLTEALKQEKERHSETRKNLTTALGDAVDLLTKAQGKRSVTTPNLNLTEDPLQKLPPSQIPPLQLPPFNS